jgi:hypothetical protein
VLRMAARLQMAARWLVTGLWLAGCGAPTSGRASQTETTTPIAVPVLSPDHRLAGIATARDDPKLPGSYLDAEMSLVDVQSGSVVQRLALWPAPAGMAEVLFSSFSPRGKWLQIQFGEGFATFDVQTGRAVAIPSGGGSRLAFSPSERLALLEGKDALLVMTLADGTTRRFPNELGEYCLAGSQLSPPSSCPEAARPLPAAPSSATPARP